MIQINILSHNNNRHLYTSKALDFLKTINHKNQIKLIIYCTNNYDFWNNKIKELIYAGIDSKINFVADNNNNYLSKIEQCIETDCEYSCSMDDDILLSNYLWDFIIENIDILKNDNNLFLSPIISNGIPSIDLFLQDFCNEHEKKIMHDIFLNTYIDNYWNVDYSSLNDYKNIWPSDYYEKVKKINHYYKGIHPYRISSLAHIELAKIICKNYKKFLNKNNYYIEQYKFPYFCNSFYFIKTSTWKKIIKDKNLFRDQFDEVPLNLYMENNNLNMLFIRNGFCLHMAYNTIGQIQQKEIENFYIENFIQYI